MFSSRRTADRAAAALAATVLSAALLWYFHARSWYPIDEGNYAHVAERVATGEVLNLQVQDIHAGYINFLNAAAFRLFGFDLLSLRYPLVAAALTESLLVFALIAGRGILNAMVASVAVTALGAIQFLNPTAHWYCAFLAVAVAFLLTRVPKDHAWRLVGAGFLVGLAALFRQLSGIWIGMPVVLVALAERDDDASGVRALFARGLGVVMLLGLMAYITSTREWIGGLLIGSPAAALLAWSVKWLRVSNRRALQAVVELGAGLLLAGLPLLAYHVVHHSVGSWLADTVGAATGLTQLAFFGRPWYAASVIAGLHQLFSTADPVKWVNGWYWASLPLVGLASGIGVLRSLRTGLPVAQQVFPVMAVFYSLVSLHFQIPIYLYYSVGLSLAAVLWQSATGSVLQRRATVVAAVALSAIGIVFHAGQPYSRTPLQMLEGVRRSGELVEGMERCSLLIDAADRDVYARLVGLIQREVSSSETIFAVPSDAELYFLANRRNPFRFYNTALGIRSDRDLQGVLDRLASRPPPLVTFRPDDKYNTAASQRIMEIVRARYDLLETIGGVEVYRLKQSQDPGGRQSPGA